MMSKDNTKKYERTDWNLKYVIWGFAILVVSVVVMFAASWWIFREFRGSAASRQIGTVRGNEDLPPEPRLQVSPSRDLDEMRNREDAVLNSYGWIDRAHGVVRIPIARAMELVAQRGFPAEKRGGNSK